MTAPDPSAPQRVAADPRHSAWVTANAGSGKTKVLIDRVARLLLGGEKDETPPDPAKILCLTYTRAAAANMQNKLFARLGGWALMEDSALRDALRELDPSRGDAIPLERARQLFAQALETPGGLKIQTIHAFCESLLRRFPLEAKISPHFELLDEVATAELLAEARDNTIRLALEGGNAALRDAAIFIIDRVQEFGIDALVAEIVNQRPAFDGTADAVIARVAEALGVGPEDTPEAAAAEALDGLDLDPLRELARAFQTGGKHEQAVAPELLRALEDEDAGTLIAALRTAVLTKTGSPRKSFPTAAIKKALPWAEATCADLADRLIALAARERALNAFAASKAVARFGVALLGQVRTLKAKADALDFDDLIRLAGELLTEADARDWVRFKLDGGVDHILVDEAQDTSAEQWRVIGAIAEEFFAGDGARQTHRTLFVVGDEKQSIYSFQGADPRGLSRVKRQFDDLTRGANAPMQEPQLLHSFRSTPAVLDSVDRIFEDETAHDGLSGDGDAPVHLAYRKDQPGRVEFWPAAIPRDAPEPQPWYVPVDEVEPDAPHLRLAEAIATRIAGWLAAKTPIPARDRPIRPGDILILVRRRNVFADAMIRALKARDIPVAGEDRMVLTDQLAVRDLMALARFALLPDDDLTLATVLRSPVVGISEDDLFRLAHGRERRKLWSVLYQQREDPAFSQAYAILDDLQKRADFMRPYEFLDHALTTHGARARFLGRLGVQAEDPIDELLAQALAFESAATPTLQAFVERIDATTFQVKREMEQGRNEVRILTAHGAKGLEANIVFLPDTVALPPANRTSLFTVETPGGDAPLWSRRKAEDAEPVTARREGRRLAEMQEYRRLLYVAMTRARDWLIVCGYRGAREASDESWLRLVERGFGDAHDCETPLTDEVGTTIPGLMIETDGKARETPDPLAAEEWSAAPFDPALMQSVREAGEAVAPISPSRLTESDPTDPPPLPSADETGDENWSSADRGTLMHAMLERLAPIPAADRAAIGARGLPSDAEKAALEAVLAILANPDFGWIFGPDSLPEVPIAGPVAALDGRVVSGLIDRLVVREDRIDVVDFKSGARHDPMPEAYLRQLAVYVAVLTEVYPTRPVHAHLLWIDSARFDTATPDDLAGALARAKAHIKTKA